MINLIQELLNPGDIVTLYLTGEIEPLHATFVKAADHAIVVKNASGLCIVKIDSVYKCIVPDSSPAISDPTPAPAESPAAVLEEYVTEEPETIDEISSEKADSDEAFSPIFTPKVVGHIDLDSIVDRRRKRPYNAVQPSADNPLVPAGGTVNSIGPSFGFITGVNGDTFFFSRGEIMQRNRMEEIHVGSPVVFTPARNPKGEAAKCVHVQMTVQEQIEWIQKVEQFDPRNARLLAEQLLVAFPEDQVLASTLESFNIRPRFRANPYSKVGVPVAEKVLAAVAQGYYVEPAELLRAEKEIAATKPYEEAFELISNLLDFAKTNSRQQCYQLYVRLIKLARNQEDTDRVFATINDAIDFYVDETGARAYFEGLRRKAIAEPEEKVTVDVVPETFDKIMSSIKTSVIIQGSEEQVLTETLDKIHGQLAPINECVCGRFNAGEIEQDSLFERRFFYAILKSLSEAVAKKFDTEFQLPDEAEFFTETINDFTVMATLNNSIKELRYLLADRPDATRRKLHVVCTVDQFGCVIDSIYSGKLSENFMRHFKAVAETPGVSLQMVATTTTGIAELMNRPSNKGVFKTFTVLDLPGQVPAETTEETPAE